MTGGAQRSLGILNLVPRGKMGKTTAALSAAKVLAGARQSKKSHRAPPTRVLSFFVTRHATSRVTVVTHGSRLNESLHQIFEMLIRNGGESIYFFSKFCLHFAADVFLNLLNIWPRRLSSEFGSNSFFQNVVLRKFSHD